MASAAAATNREAIHNQTRKETTIMANIKNTELGKTLAADPRITIKSSLFGLVTKSVYTPTDSPLAVYRFEYPADKGDKVARLLSLVGEPLKQAAAEIKTLKTDGIGNTRLEACVSADQQFAALQLFRYSNFLPTPMTKVIVFEGDDAKTIGGLL